MEKESPKKETPPTQPPPPETYSHTTAEGGIKHLIFLDNQGVVTNLSSASRVTIAADRIKVYDGGLVHEIKCKTVEAAKVVFGTLVNHHLAYNLVIGHPIPNTQPLENKNENIERPTGAVQEEKENGESVDAESNTGTGEPISESGNAGSNGQSESVSESGETYHESSKELKLVK